MPVVFRALAQPDIPWSKLDAFADRTVFQTKPWLEFVSATKRAYPIVCQVDQDGQCVGYFTGLIVRKLGLRILGSPLPGWTTAYQGFNLLPGVSRMPLVQPLLEFAFRDLGCIHVEMMDRAITVGEARGLGLAHRIQSGYEIDLTQDEDALFGKMHSACRRCIRKAEKCGVTILEAGDEEFASEYYAQLKDVFAKQSLVPTYGIERVRGLLRHLLPSGQLLLLRALDAQGRCIATGIFPAQNQIMQFWGGASWRPDQHLRPNEAIMWYAMRYWKRRGIARFDMGGAGKYKAKYGGYEIQVPWVRASKYVFLESARNTAKSLFAFKQAVLGRLRGDAFPGDPLDDKT